MILQPIGYSPKGFSKPNKWNYWMWRACTEAAEYYQSEIGKTVIVSTPVGFNGTTTWVQKYTDRAPLIWNGFNLVIDAVEEIKAKGYNMCNWNKLYVLCYFHPPLTPNPFIFNWDGAEQSIPHEGNPHGLGGMVGLENFGCGLGPRGDGRPGMSIGGDVTTWLMCNYSKEKLISQGWPESWPMNYTANPRTLAWRGLAHEIGHQAGLGHPDPDDGSIMGMWMWENRHFTLEQKTLLLNSGLFS